MKIIKLSVIILLTYIHLSEGKMKSSTTHTHKKVKELTRKKIRKIHHPTIKTETVVVDRVTVCQVCEVLHVADVEKNKKEMVYQLI